MRETLEKRRNKKKQKARERGRGFLANQKKKKKKNNNRTNNKTRITNKEMIKLKLNKLFPFVINNKKLKSNLNLRIDFYQFIIKSIIIFYKIH